MGSVRDLWLIRIHLKSLLANSSELEVGGNLKLNDDQLKLLPEGFENISVGGTLCLANNQLGQQPCTFPNVQGEVKLESND